METYYTVYKITNKINGRIYIGCHKTVNLDDSYMGSGLQIKHAIKKYGVENFEKEIIAIFDNPDDMSEMEAILVNEEFIKDRTTYNIRLGGIGNLMEYYGTEDHRTQGLKSIKLYDEIHGEGAWVKRGHEALKEKYGNNYMQVLQEMGKRKIKELYPNGIWYGRNHTEESKKLISKAKIGTGTGKDNSQYGTAWVCNYESGEEKKIQKKEIEYYENSGWARGRIKKNVTGIKNGVVHFSTKNCGRCGKEFQPKSNKQKYCSKECRTGADYYGREEEFLTLYDELGNMNAALKEMGYPGSISNWYYWAKSTLNARENKV